MGGIKASSLWRWPGTLSPAPVTKLTAHVDFFPTLAELAGAPITDELQRQVEGRSLVPLLENPAAEWADRRLFTHVGRWPKDADPQKYKFTQCSIRTQRWHLVNASGAAPKAAKGKAKAKKTAAKAPAEPMKNAIVKAGPEPLNASWQLFDIEADPGEQTDVAAAHPDVVQELAAAYDAWWESVQPMLVNEKAPLASENPFKTLFEKQFGQ
jgi:arylsulfatase